MTELDAELLERVARWCAEAGRQAGAAEIRAALGPLGWDELLAVRALLADPPPARPLGPHALADLARGTPADVAAERERAGRYHREEADAAGGGEVPAPPPARRRSPPAGARAVVVRRARDRVAPPAAAPPPRPLIDELRLPGGRAVLERLVRRHGGRRAVIGRELAAGWRRADGAEVGEADVAALLDLHGLARPFARRERDELLHALRAAGGVRARAAARIGLDPPGLEAALARLGVEREAERIRDERRADLRARATLIDRVHQLLDDPERLADLGLLAEIEGDLRARLPEHVRALRAGPAPTAAAFRASLSLEPRAAEALVSRFELDLGPSAAGRPWADRTGGDRRPRGRDARPGPREVRGAPGREVETGAGPRLPVPRGARPGPRGAAPGGERSGAGRGAQLGGARPGFSRPRPARTAAPGRQPSASGRGRPGAATRTGKKPGSPRPTGGRRGTPTRPGAAGPGARPPPRGRGPRRP